MTMTQPPLLSVDGLTTTFETDAGLLTAVVRHRTGTLDHRLHADGEAERRLIREQDIRLRRADDERPEQAQREDADEEGEADDRRPIPFELAPVVLRHPGSLIQR